MTGMGIADLAQSLQLRRHNAKLQTDLVRLTEEATTGRSASLSAAVGGDHRMSAALTRSLTLLSAYRTSTAEAGLVAQVMQASISTVQDQLESVATAALSAGASGQASMIAPAAQDAEQRLGSAISALNAQVAGRSVFSGARSTTTAMGPAEELMAALVSATTSDATSDDVVASVDAWFDDPAGFGAFYTGADTPLAPLQIGEDESTLLSVTGADTEIRTALKGLALAALAGRGVPASGDEKAQLMLAAGEKMLGGQGALAELAAKVGVVESRIDQAATRNSAQAAAIEIALAELTSVDEYEAAISLEAAEQRLETLYAITARLGQLSLTDYI